MKGVRGRGLARILAVSANLIELMGRVLIRRSWMALMISASLGDPDRGPDGGVKDSPSLRLHWSWCSSELIDEMQGV